MYIFFDTETTGLPKNWKAPVTDSQNWPRVVQIAWIRFDAKEQVIESCDRIVKPQGFEIPEISAKIHGITTEIALSQGSLLEIVMGEFSEALKKSQIVIAHNMGFDRSVVGAEFHRLEMEDAMLPLKQLCTKELSTQFCQLPSKFGYKWPTLQELHFKLFGESFGEAHNASIDVNICAKCFFELKKLGQLQQLEDVR